MLLDAFMAFLVLVGAVQFAYCVLAGNYVCFFFVLSCQSMLTLVSSRIALQRLPEWILRRRRPIRSHG